MDPMSINDLFLECIRAFVMLALLAVLFLRGSLTSLGRHPGWKSILGGFCLITMATLLDITDEIPGLEKYIVIGDTIYEAFLEKLPGYLLGFILVLVGFYRMIPSLQRVEKQEQALQDSEDRFRKIFESNPDPVILARLDNGDILDVNPAFVKQAGYNRETVLGKNSADLKLWSQPGQREEFRNALQQNGAVENMESDFRLKNGTTQPGLLSAKVVAISGIPCILIVVRDISKIKEAEKALKEMDRIRNEFVSTAAHELRTPLSVLIGYAELLTSPEGLDKFSDEKRLEFLEEIKLKGLVLSQIIDDLLDISRMESGSQFSLSLGLTNPDDLLRKAFEQFQLGSSSHRFCLDLPVGNETEIECDSKRLLQVLENLLSNAAKYSPKDSLITLASAEHPESYEFSVTDNGIGMTPEQIAKVFDKFYRVDASNTAVGGLGLGMCIAKQVVDAHQGTITIDSTPGKGTCIRVVIPKRQGQGESGV